MIGILSFVGFTALVAIISYFATRNINESTSDGYFLAGRSLGAVVIAGSLLMTNLSTEQMVGLNGQAFSEGLVVMAWETLAAIAIVLTAIFLLPRYLKGGLTTIPQFLETRFDKTTKIIVSILFLSGYMIILLPIVLYSGALAISGMFELPEMLGISHTASIWLCVWGIGIVGSIYAIFGGLKAVAVSDTVNGAGLLIGGMLIPIFGLLMVGDGNIFEGIDVLVQQHPEKFNPIGSPESSVPFFTIFTGLMLVNLFYWGANQAIIQRALGAKNLKEGQKGLLLTAFIKIFTPIMMVLPGIIAFQLFQGNLARPDMAYPALVNEVLPPVLLGFFAAVLVGAILSSFNSALNSSVTLFGFDIYKEYFDKEASEEKVVRKGKIFGIILALFSMGIAPFIANAPDGLFGYLQEVNGAYSIPILTIIVMGYLHKRVTAYAAKFALISGVVLYLIYLFLKYFVVDEGVLPHYLHAMAIIFVFNIILMLIMSKIKPRKTAYVVEYTNQVEITPWKYVKPVGIAICVLVVAIYTYFAQF